MTTVTRSRSPGCAPWTAMGPVTTCGPSCAASRAESRAISMASSSTASGCTPCFPKKATGS
ncbi:hypothetical protein ACFPRL_10580 [Pseudoclavibacter helvolus]